MPPTTHSPARQPPQAPLSSPIDAASSVAEAAFANAAARVANESPGAVRLAARAAAASAAAVHLCRPRNPAAASVRRAHPGTLSVGARGSCAPRKRRTCTLTLKDKLAVITAREGGMSFVSIRSTVAPAASIENQRKVWERRSQQGPAVSSCSTPVYRNDRSPTVKLGVFGDF